MAHPSLPRSKNTQIRGCCSASLGPQSRALETLLLHLCVIRIEPATTGLALHQLVQEKKRFHLAALFRLSKVIGPNKSNPESEISHFLGVWTLKKIIRSYRCLFPHVSEWEKVFLGSVASHDGVIPQENVLYFQILMLTGKYRGYSLLYSGRKQRCVVQVYSIHSVVWSMTVEVMMVSCHTLLMCRCITSVDRRPPTLVTACCRRYKELTTATFLLWPSVNGPITWLASPWVHSCRQRNTQEDTLCVCFCWSCWFFYPFKHNFNYEHHGGVKTVKHKCCCTHQLFRLDTEELDGLGSVLRHSQREVWIHCCYIQLTANKQIKVGFSNPLK